MGTETDGREGRLPTVKKMTLVDILSIFLNSEAGEIGCIFLAAAVFVFMVGIAVGVGNLLTNWKP